MPAVRGGVQRHVRTGLADLGAGTVHAGRAGGVYGVFLGDGKIAVAYAGIRMPGAVWHRRLLLFAIRSGLSFRACPAVARSYRWRSPGHAGNGWDRLLR